MVARWVPGWRTRERLTAAVVVQLVTLQAAFVGLAAVGLFEAVPAAVVSVALVVAACTAVARPNRLAPMAAGDLAAAGHAVASAPLVAKVLGVAISVLAAMKATRMFVSPPMAWDDLTYHLVKAGAWAGAGSFTTTPSPDAWTYYEHFAPGGEVLSSWMLVASPSGGALGLLSLVVWAAIAVAARSAARGLGLDVGRAALAAIALAGVPAVTAFVESSYVDNLAVLAFLAGLVCVLAVRPAPSAAGLLLAAAAFGLGAGVKQSMLLVAALGWAWLLAIGWRHRTSIGLARVVLALGGGVAVAAPAYVRAWIVTGSPMYPFQAPLLGDRFSSNQQLQDVLSGRVAGGEDAALDLRGLGDALDQTVTVLGRGDLNWPPWPVVWLVLGVAGAVLLLRDRSRRAPASFLVLAVLAVWGPLLLPESQTLRLWWAGVLGRLLLPAFAALVLLACSVRPRAAGFVLWCVAALQVRASWVVFGSSWGEIDDEAVGDLLVALVLGGALALGGVVAVRRGARAKSRWAVGAGILAGVAGLAVVGGEAESTRDVVRYDYYDATTQGDSWRVEPLGSAACTSPMWEAVDGPDGLRVAVAAGFAAPAGHNNLRAPFLGADLQNELVYVPFTTDGAIVDLATPVDVERIDEGAWLRRLDELDVDVVALLAPEPPELAFVEAHPERFRLVAESACGEPSTLYEVVD